MRSNQYIYLVLLSVYIAKLVMGIYISIDRRRQRTELREKQERHDREVIAPIEARTAALVSERIKLYGR